MRPSNPHSGLSTNGLANYPPRFRCSCHFTARNPPRRASAARVVPSGLGGVLQMDREAALGITFADCVCDRMGGLSLSLRNHPNAGGLPMYGQPTAHRPPPMRSCLDLVSRFFLWCRPWEEDARSDGRRRIGCSCLAPPPTHAARRPPSTTHHLSAGGMYVSTVVGSGTFCVGFGGCGRRSLRKNGLTVLSMGGLRSWRYPAVDEIHPSQPCANDLSGHRSDSHHGHERF